MGFVKGAPLKGLKEVGFWRDTRRVPSEEKLAALVKERYGLFAGAAVDALMKSRAAEQLREAALPGYPDPRVLPPLDLPEGDKQRLADYLRNGRVVASYMGNSWCRFECGVFDWEMGCKDLSDGVWLWPEGLVHYIEVHNVSLPQEFIFHALRKR